MKYQHGISVHLGFLLFKHLWMCNRIGTRRFGEKVFSLELFFTLFYQHMERVFAWHVFHVIESESGQIDTGKQVFANP